MFLLRTFPSERVHNKSTRAFPVNEITPGTHCILFVSVCRFGGGVPVRLKVIGYVKLLHADFAKFVLAIVQILTDIKSFCVILLLILLMFANVFYISLAPAASGGDDDEEAGGDVDADDDEPFHNVPETLLTLYRMMLGGSSPHVASHVYCSLKHLSSLHDTHYITLHTLHTHTTHYTLHHIA